MKNKRFCPRLWEEVYINQYGNVYSCCHNKPGILGNIYREKLESICNNKTTRDFRQKSLDGQLKCFDKCTLLDKDKIGEPGEALIIDYNNLKRLKILVGEACNISCIMCWQNHKNKECLDYAKFITNVNVDPFSDIEIQGGEPFFIPAIKLFFEFLTFKGKKVSFLTNGMLINDKWAEKVALNSKWVKFSINAATQKTHELVNRGSRWKLVLKNIQTIRGARAKYHSELEIIGNMTIVPQNIREIPLFINNFNRLGFDSIAFCYDRHVPLYLNRRPYLKTKISSEIKKAINKFGDCASIDSLCLRMLSLVK